MSDTIYLPCHYKSCPNYKRCLDEYLEEYGEDYKGIVRITCTLASFPHITDGLMEVEKNEPSSSNDD